MECLHGVSYYSRINAVHIVVFPKDTINRKSIIKKSQTSKNSLQTVQPSLTLI